MDWEAIAEQAWIEVRPFALTPVAKETARSKEGWFPLTASRETTAQSVVGLAPMAIFKPVTRTASPQHARPRACPRVYPPYICVVCSLHLSGRVRD